MYLQGKSYRNTTYYYNIGSKMHLYVLIINWLNTLDVEAI